MNAWPSPTPFGLSLSKAYSCSATLKNGKLGFDKLSPNGVRNGREAH
jgi:hypothetical protein